MKQITTAACFLLLSFIVCAQEPCKTEPFAGYTGNCKVAVSTAIDGKHFFTTDGYTLKVWDLKTMKVVDEHPNFPYKSLSPTSDPDIYGVDYLKLYSISRRITIDLKHDLLAGKQIKFPKKYINYGTEPKAIAFDSALNIYILKTGAPYGVRTSTQFLKLDPANNNEIAVVYSAKGSVEKEVYNPQLHWLAVTDEDGTKIINTQNGAEVTRLPGTGSYFTPSPDGKYVALVGTFKAFFLEKATGKFLGATSGNKGGMEGRVHWKNNGQGVYFAATGSCTHGADCINQLGEYTLPDVQLVKDHVDPAKPFEYFHNYILDADGGKLYYAPYNQIKKYEFVAINLADKKQDKRLVLGYTPSADIAKKEADEKVQRMRNFNQMVDKLFELTKPATHHMYGEVLRPDAVTATGDVLVKELEQLIHWRFPEAKPQGIYISVTSPRKEGVGVNKIPAAGPIVAGYISPSGKEVGVAYNKETGGFEIFKEGKSILRDPKRYIVGLLDGKALVSTYDNKTSVMESLDIIETVTGNVLKNFRGNFPTRYVDATTYPGKVFIVNDKIHVVDVNALTLTSHPIEDAQKIGFYIPVNIYAPDAIKNVAYPGMKRSKGTSQGRYYITHSDDEGFNIYDLVDRKNVNARPLYPAWNGWDNVVFLPGTQQLLIMRTSPGYARPNAKDDEPGASAYTVDIKSGAITPYLLHNDRSTIIAANKKAEAEWKAFEANVCAYAEYQLRKGAMLVEKNGERVIKVGTDCADSAHVMARLKPTNDAKTVFTTTFEKWDFGKRDYSEFNQKANMRLCHGCGGFPETTSTTKTSGWSDWQQVNFNVYSRVYKKNIISTTTHICNNCNGRGIL